MSQYCVAIWPFAASFSMKASEAMNRPSPWETGAMYTSPTRVCISHGLRSEAMRVRTSRDWWRPMSLKVSVASLQRSASRISP